MRQLSFVFALLLLVITVPATAQADGDPADYLPASISQYLEVRTDEASLEQLRALVQVVARLANSEVAADEALDLAMMGFAPQLGFAGIESVDDLLAWTGGRVGLGTYAPVDPTGMNGSQMTLVFPIADAEGASAFVESLMADAEPLQTLGSVQLYMLDQELTLAAADETIWLGSLEAVEQTLDDLENGTLSSADWFNRVKSQLPAEALMAGYVNGAWVGTQISMQESFSGPSSPSAEAIFEAVLRIHPAVSEMEDAFLQMPPFLGAGFSLDYVDGRADITGAAIVAATYPAPTLTTESAGAELLDVIPADSYAVYDMYDAVLLCAAVGGLGLMGPAIGSVFDNIVFELENPGAPTPTPTPTPTPLPPPTAAELIDQAQPYILQIEAILGIPLEEAYSLINGEFAIAAFPNPQTGSITGGIPAPGVALWLQSSDAPQLIDVVQESINSVLALSAGMTGVSPADMFAQETVNGVDVTFVSLPDTPERAAYGIVNENVVFVTTERSLETVISAAGDDISITETRAFPGEIYQSFGTGQEALFFADLAKIQSAMRGPYDTGEPQDIGRMIASADVAENGNFLLRLSWLLP